jgi:hypothetical protein
MAIILSVFLVVRFAGFLVFYLTGEVGLCDQMLAGRCGRCACKLFGSCHHILGFPGEGDAATALSSDARTLCHDCLNDLFCGLPCGIHKAASRAVTEIFCHVHFSFLGGNA